MTNPITPEGAASAQNPLPPVPTTKVLAISHFHGHAHDTRPARPDYAARSA